MTNNKQQTALEIFWNQLPEILPFTVDTATAVKLDEAYRQAKEIEEEKLDVAYGNGYEQGEMDFYKKMQGKGNQYADGYAEGYKRALELTQWTISNLIPPQEGLTI